MSAADDIRRRRRRFAVALLIPPPVAVEIDGLRRALGDRQLGRIDPHITLVPPINLHDEQVAEAMAVVDAAASEAAPFDVVLGPVETFAADSPVRFLRVEPWEPVVALYRACWTGVFDRPKRQSFHPHVTIDIDGGPTDRPDPALEVLADYRAEVTLDRISLLEHDDHPDRRGWNVFNAYRLG